MTSPFIELGLSPGPFGLQPPDLRRSPVQKRQFEAEADLPASRVLPSGQFAGDLYKPRPGNPPSAGFGHIGVGLGVPCAQRPQVTGSGSPAML